MATLVKTLYRWDWKLQSYASKNVKENTSLKMQRYVISSRMIKRPFSDIHLWAKYLQKYFLEKIDQDPRTLVWLLNFSM